MNYKESFIKFMVESGVLTFGDFTLKSGRKAPYFVNTGNYNVLENIMLNVLKKTMFRLIHFLDLHIRVFPLQLHAVLLCLINTVLM